MLKYVQSRLLSAMADLGYIMDNMAAVPSRKNNLSQLSQTEEFQRLKRQNEELILLNRSKDEFIAITSHQLRTPATAVKQYLGLLLEGYSDPLTEGQKDFLAKAYENNERQLHVVDDLLRIAQLDLDKLKLRRRKVDLRRVVIESAAALGSLFEHRDQRLVLSLPDEPVLGLVDKDRIRQVTENLLENASNYSQDHTKIIVSVKKLSGGQCRVVIKDEGVGISQKDMPKLFLKFSRIPNPLSNTVNGTGLGLYFCKRVVELHGGRISVRSSVGKGSIFAISLPAA